MMTIVKTARNDIVHKPGRGPAFPPREDRWSLRYWAQWWNMRDGFSAAQIHYRLREAFFR